MQEDLADIKKVLLCSKNNQAKFVCVNANCKQPGVFCPNDCQCSQKKHKDHSFQKIKDIKEKINEDLKKAPQQGKNQLTVIKEQISKMALQLSQKSFEMESTINYFNLAKNQAKFMQLQKDNQIQKINGELMSQVLKQNQNGIKPKLASKETVNGILKQVKNKFNSIKNLLDYLIDMNAYKKISFQDKSQITDQFPIIQEYVRETMKKQIKQFQKLYRASQENFSQRNFHTKCDSKNNTLILIKTQFDDKIIGGFTQNIWNQYNNNNAQYVNNKNTFIFSLTEKQKMECKENYNTLYCNPNNCPSFAYQIHIANNANDTNCSCNYNSYYMINKKKYDTAEKFYKAFCGNPQGKNTFKIVQWEVYQVIFQN